MCVRLSEGVWSPQTALVEALALLAALLVLPLILAPRAEANAYIYWTNWGWGPAGTIGRANLHGTASIARTWDFGVTRVADGK